MEVNIGITWTYIRANMVYVYCDCFGRNRSKTKNVSSVNADGFY